MITAIQRIDYYFGLVGVASIVVWMVALILASLFAIRWRRSKVIWAALVLATVALLLARVNSQQVSEIKIDLSKEIAAAQARAEQEAAAARKEIETDISKEAEDAKRAETDDAEKTDSKTKDKKTSDKAKSGHSYRQAGKVERAEGMQTEDKIPIEADAAEEDAEDDANVRMMPMHEVAHANRLDRLNLLLAKLTLAATVLLVLIDYARRFNSTFDCYLPLPLGGRLLDSVFAKTHTVCDARTERDWKRFLERAVRKGETFILFTEKDPWSDETLCRLPKQIPLRWRLDKVACGEQDTHLDDEFLFESVWYGRYCFVVIGSESDLLQRLDALGEFLEYRHATRATAPQTVNVVWNRSTEIPRETLDGLLPLCRETNFKLILSLATPPKPSLAEQFEETYS